MNNNIVLENKQLPLFSDVTVDDVCVKKMYSRSGTFTDNMKLPIHRWFRYSAGFSANWVEKEILNFSDNGSITVNVLDPFAGSGTTLLAAESVRVNAVGFESHPFIYRVAKAKLGWILDLDLLRYLSSKLLREASTNTEKTTRLNIPLLAECFTNESLSRLDALRSVFLSDIDDGTKESEMIWLCITSIIRSCSIAGTAQWQYVLPKKKKLYVLDPFEAFSFKMDQIIKDIIFAYDNEWLHNAEILQIDAREPVFHGRESIDMVITSPPYPNNYDYADATRLEMTFWGEIKEWGDLHSSVRQYLLRSCSQHSAKEKLQLNDLLENNVLMPIKNELSIACRELEKVRLNKGGKKTYHTMAAAYFSDLGNVFHALRSLCRDGSKICFVIGDSAPYGVYLSVDKWLGELALSAGFKSFFFEKIRDRNVKWKNRKHQVPLHEGRLWING